MHSWFNLLLKHYKSLFDTISSQNKIVGNFTENLMAKEPTKLGTNRDGNWGKIGYFGKNEELYM